MADDVQLTDLEVIQRYSLAVRGATASRRELVQALESDLLWLTGDRRFRPAEPPESEEPAAPAVQGPARRAPARKSDPAKATTKRTAQA
ncbi:MAG: hypothetical protein KY440_00350 [Actinobacteria bacterium]|nr:hypothetical protein [Actinomycetota bacterium]